MIPQSINLFRTLGGVIHLLQDIAQAQHTKQRVDTARSDRSAPHEV